MNESTVEPMDASDGCFRGHSVDSNRIRMTPFHSIFYPLLPIADRVNLDLEGVRSETFFTKTALGNFGHPPMPRE